MIVSVRNSHELGKFHEWEPVLGQAGCLPHERDPTLVASNRHNGRFATTALIDPKRVS